MDEKLLVDFLILADRAEALDGKLYMMGGAWEQTLASDLEQPVKISLALAVLVPWNRTNEDHTAKITIEDLDQKPMDFRIDATFAQGRPPLLRGGETQRVVMALSDLVFKAPSYGDYQLVVYLNGERAKDVRFRVVSPTAVGVPMPPLR